jgi:hypothetical protein
MISEQGIGKDMEGSDLCPDYYPHISMEGLNKSTIAGLLAEIRSLYFPSTKEH